MARAQKVLTNPNLMVGADRLKPGRHARREKANEPELKMLSARVPSSLYDEVEDMVSKLSTGTIKVSKQAYVARAIELALKSDSEAIERGENPLI